MSQVQMNNVSVSVTTYILPFVSRVSLIPLCSLWKHHLSIIFPLCICMQHYWDRDSSRVGGFHTCSPLVPPSPRSPCNNPDTWLHLWNDRSCCEYSLGHTRGSWSAACCWVLISLLLFDTVSEWDLVVFLPSLPSPRAGQTDQGGRRGRGHLWVPTINEHTHTHIWWVDTSEQVYRQGMWRSQPICKRLNVALTVKLFHKA